MCMSGQAGTDHTSDHYLNTLVAWFEPVKYLNVQLIIRMQSCSLQTHPKPLTRHHWCEHLMRLRVYCIRWFSCQIKLSMNLHAQNMPYYLADDREREKINFVKLTDTWIKLSKKISLQCCTKHLVVIYHGNTYLIKMRYYKTINLILKL